MSEESTTAPRVMSVTATYIRRDKDGNDVELIPLGIIGGEDFNSTKFKIHMALTKLRHPKWAKAQKELAI